MDRVQAVRDLYAAISDALLRDPAIVAAKENLKLSGMPLTHVDIQAFFSLAAAVASDPRQSDADFLKSLRIAPDVTPCSEGKLDPQT